MGVAVTARARAEAARCVRLRDLDPYRSL